MPLVDSTISKQDALRRSQQNASVKGTLEMEGLTLDHVSAEIGRRFDAGEITLAEFSAQMQAHIAKLALAARQTEANIA